MADRMTWPEVIEATGLSESTLRRLMREGQFPLPLRLSSRRVYWLDTEVTEWLGNRPRRTLVLEAD